MKVISLDDFRLKCFNRDMGLGDGPGTELIPHSGRSPCPCVIKKYACHPKLIPSSDRSSLCKTREA